MLYCRTYTNAIHHCLLAGAMATLNKARPARLIVGAITKGPINRIIKPISPVKPISTWNSEATIMAPCICKQTHAFITSTSNSYIQLVNTGHTS